MAKFFEMSEKEIRQYLRRNQKKILMWYYETAGSRWSRQFFPNDIVELRKLLNLGQTTTRKGWKIRKKSALLEIFPSLGERFLIYLTDREYKIRISLNLEKNIIEVEKIYDRQGVS